MGLFETIADRRIEEARAAGLFDNLPGAGRPIADLHRERPPGWWAARAVKTERDKQRREELVEDLRRARAALWRLTTEAEVERRIDAMNEEIAAHNQATTFEPVTPVDRRSTLTTWRAVRQAGPLAGRLGVK